MLNMDKKMKEESKIELRMNQLEGRVGKVEEKLQLLVNQVVHTNDILLKLLEAQNSNPNDNKKGEKDESLIKPHDDQNTEVQAQTAGPSNPNSEAIVKPPNRKRMMLDPKSFIIEGGGGGVEYDIGSFYLSLRIKFLSS